jgi:hypothetical protein
MARGRGDIVFEIGGDTGSLVSAGQRGQSALNIMETAAKKAEAQIKSLERKSSDFQRAVQSGLGMDKLAKSARESALAFEKLAKAQDQMDALRASIDPLYAASKRYEQALYQLDGALEAGAISAAQHEAMVERVGQAYLTTGTQAQASAANMSGFAGVMARNKGTIQQFGFQIQDVAVQLAAGTNATTVFAQQGSQMLSIFGPVGAVLGALAAVTLPLLGAAFFSAGEEARSLSETLDAMDAAVDRFVASTADASVPLDELKEKYGTLADEAQRALAAMAAADQVQAMAEIKAAADAMILSFADAFAAIEQQSSAGRIAMDGLMAALGMSNQQVRDFKRGLLELQAAETFREAADAASRLMAQLDAARDAAGQLPPELQSVYDALARIVPKAAEANAKIDAMAGLLRAASAAASAAAGAVSSIGKAASGAYGAVSSLAAKMLEMAQAKAAALAPGKLAATGADGRGSQRDTVAGSRTVMPDQPWMNTGGGGGGGGGGGQDPLVGELETLRNSLLSQEEMQIESFAKQQETLDAALAQRLLTQQEYAALMEQAQREHQEKMSEIDVWRYGTGLEKAEAFMGGMADALQGGNEKMLKISKAFGAGEALINAWRAYSQTISDPKLPWFAKLAAGAKVLAAGMGAVKAIQGVGSGGTSSAGGAASATTAAQTPVQNVTVEWRGPSSMFQSMSGLIDALNEAARRGYRVNATLVQGAMA